ncbi:MAG: hypothetical protein ACREAM_22060 [Blastocatellia bacterium]
MAQKIGCLSNLFVTPEERFFDLDGGARLFESPGLQAELRDPANNQRRQQKFIDLSRRFTLAI